jgi:hypothetical protein
VADARRFGAGGRLAISVLAAAALLAAALAGCGASSEASDDPLVGFWIGGAMGDQMTMVQVGKDGEEYIVLANPDAPAGEAQKEGESLVIDTHAVGMRLTPSGEDELTLEFSGDMFESGRSVKLKRVNETQYADASVAQGVSVLERGLAMWKAGGGKKYPPAAEVAVDGLLGKMVRWPTNPFTGGPMEQGDDPGDFVYERLDGGKEYSLLAHLSDGSTIGQ